MDLPKTLSPPKAILLSMILLAAVCWIDYSTGQLSITLLYLLPIGISSWYSKSRSALALSLLAALGWFGAFYHGVVHHGLGLAVWNSCVTLAIFLTFSYVLAQLKIAKNRLERSADFLGAQVQERTVALDSSNQELRQTAERLKILNDALQIRTEQLRGLAFELTRAEEQERHRIAHLLHDELQQFLVAAKFALTALATRKPTDGMISKLETIQDLLDRAIATSRSLTAELVPPMLYERGLTEALRWLARWMQEKHGLLVMIDADEWENQFAQDVRLVLFNSVRELLFNVVKHSQAKRAFVSLRGSGTDTISIRIQDEGVGFDPAAENGQDRKSGFGLVAVRERLAMMGGSLRIDSAPGHGTTSTIEMPTRFDPTLP